jgi:hypothetical protein
MVLPPVCSGLAACQISDIFLYFHGGLWYNNKWEIVDMIEFYGG